MTIANVKGMVAKVMLAGLAAGALLAIAPAKAEAQGFGVGVRFGYPAPVFVSAYPRRDFAFERREAFLRHEEWERAHRFDRRFGYR
jgi:hypothetical protein